MVWMGNLLGSELSRKTPLLDRDCHSEKRKAIRRKFRTIFILIFLGQRTTYWSHYCCLPMEHWKGKGKKKRITKMFSIKQLVYACNLLQVQYTSHIGVNILTLRVYLNLNVSSSIQLFPYVSSIVLDTIWPYLQKYLNSDQERFN